MKPVLELPSQFRSEADFNAELGELLAERNFFFRNGRLVHLVDVPGQEPQFVEATPEYVSEHVNREFQTVERTERQSIEPGQVRCRTHDDGNYEFPIKVKITDTQIANFSCRHCGQSIRWKQSKSGIVVLSCHCFSVLHGPPTQPVIIDEEQWALWIVDYLLQEKEERLHSN